MSPKLVRVMISWFWVFYWWLLKIQDIIILNNYWDTSFSINYITFYFHLFTSIIFSMIALNILSVQITVPLSNSIRDIKTGRNVFFILSHQSYSVLTNKVCPSSTSLYSVDSTQLRISSVISDT